MQNTPFSLELICIIVPFGLGSKVLKEAKAQGITGGTVIIGKGTYHKSWLHLLELGESRKEILLMIAPSSVSTKAMIAINEKFKLTKPNHGIAFTTHLQTFLGSGQYDYHEKEKIGEEFMDKYLAIFTIVDKGKGEAVVEAATEVGSKGATIINARGSGIHETSKIFSMEIEPEKEIVLMIAKHEIVKDIVETICDTLEISKPGNGIIFVQDVKETYGIL
jgi:nitrogen regulatory protein PII